MRTQFPLLLLAALASAPAWSEPSFYVGLRAGTDLDGRFDDIGGNIDTDTPWGGYAGWRINDTFAIEFAGATLGESRRSGIADGGFEVDGSLFQLGVVATLPLAERFDLLGGVGAYRIEEDGEASTIAGPRDIDYSESGAYLELGSRFRINEQWSLRASYTWFDLDAGADGNFWGGVQLDF
jgi:hypothetical protein